MQLRLQTPHGMGEFRIKYYIICVYYYAFVRFYFQYERKRLIFFIFLWHTISQIVEGIMPTTRRGKPNTKEKRWIKNYLLNIPRERPNHIGTGINLRPIVLTRCWDRVCEMPCTRICVSCVVVNMRYYHYYYYNYIFLFLPVIIVFFLLCRLWPLACDEYKNVAGRAFWVISTRTHIQIQGVFQRGMQYVKAISLFVMIEMYSLR